MAKKTLEEMLNDSSRQSSSSASQRQGRQGKRKREFTKKEKSRLAIYWTILIVCLIGFILMLIFVINNNPLDGTGQIRLPSCTYSVSRTSINLKGIFQ